MRIEVNTAALVKGSLKMGVAYDRFTFDLPNRIIRFYMQGREVASMKTPLLAYGDTLTVDGVAGFLDMTLGV